MWGAVHQHSLERSINYMVTAHLGSGGLSRRPSAQEHINSIAAEKVYLIGRRRHSALLPRRQTLFVVSA